MIGQIESGSAAGPPRSAADIAASVAPAAAAPAATAPTAREAQRQATRRSILDATVACLVDDGYGALTTRRIAERAGIAQSTLMHHFQAREALIVEAVAALAEHLAARAIDELDLEALRGPADRAAVLERAWATFTAPEALAAAQLWGAAWTEPELAAALGELELRVAALVLSSAAVVFPDESSDPRFAVMIDGVVQMIRGLIMAIPTWGRETVEARWQALVPMLVKAADHLVAPTGVRGAAPPEARAPGVGPPEAAPPEAGPLEAASAKAAPPAAT